MDWPEPLYIPNRRMRSAFWAVFFLGFAVLGAFILLSASLGWIRPLSVFKVIVFVLGLPILFVVGIGFMRNACDSLPAIEITSRGVEDRANMLRRGLIPWDAIESAEQARLARFDTVRLRLRNLDPNHPYQPKVPAIFRRKDHAEVIDLDPFGVQGYIPELLDSINQHIGYFESQHPEDRPSYTKDTT